MGGSKLAEPSAVRIVSPGESRSWGGHLLSIVEVNSVTMSYQASLKQN